MCVITSRYYITTAMYKGIIIAFYEHDYTLILVGKRHKVFDESWNYEFFNLDVVNYTVISFSSQTEG